MLRPCDTLAIATKPVAWWDFDGGNNKVASEKVSGVKDEITGYATHAEGVRGAALKFDGFTTRVVHKADISIDITKGFSVEVWCWPDDHYYAAL